MKDKISKSCQITTCGIRNSMNPIPNNALVLSTKEVSFKHKLYHICMPFTVYFCLVLHGNYDIHKKYQ